jgi:hypothetical protein
VPYHVVTPFVAGAAVVVVVALLGLDLAEDGAVGSQFVFHDVPAGDEEEQGSEGLHGESGESEGAVGT